MWLQINFDTIVYQNVTAGEEKEKRANISTDFLGENYPWGGNFTEAG